MIVRSASIDDAEAIAAIYAHHVAHGTATFDTVAPDVSQTREKIAAVLAAGWPWLVADQDRQVLGYAYATQFRDRAAYRHTCENSIYVDADRLGSGIGSALLGELLEAAARCGFLQMIAVIGGGEPASIALHALHGFVHAGRMRNVGRKFDRWLDTVYMQKALSDEADRLNERPTHLPNPSQN
jgi:phosphinothricin acetyltransferase